MATKDERRGLIEFAVAMETALLESEARAGNDPRRVIALCMELIGIRRTITRTETHKANGTDTKRSIRADERAKERLAEIVTELGPGWGISREGGGIGCISLVNPAGIQSSFSGGIRIASA